MNTKQIKLIAAILIPLLVIWVPAEWLPLKDITVVEQRMLGIFVLATLFWVLEPVPVFATSVLVVFMELILISNQSFIFFRNTVDESNFGTILKYNEIMAVFASPIILLFIGGFFLANAAKKYQLDSQMTKICLRPFGNKPGNVILGIMVLTAFFSMFMSNTATTAMMLSMVVPLLSYFEENDTGKVALILSVPFAANVGGLGTPIGSPPNAVALKYLIGNNAVSFGTWMKFGIPFVVIMLIFTWMLILKMYPIQLKEINLKFEKSRRPNLKGMTVYVVFALTILLWVTDRIHLMNSYVVAMIPVVVFSMSGIITADDLKKISWDVLWLVAGGLALGLGMERTGLSVRIVNSIPFEHMPALIIVFMATLMALFMATFMSNTATANLLLPIIFVLGASLPALEEIGGTKMIVLATTFACSLAMSLPVSTPPNAIAYASGIIKTEQLMKAGIIVGLTGLVGVYLLMFILRMVDFV